MAAASTTCFTCECGRQYACASLAAARVTKSRCHANHVHDASIRLQRGLITMSNILWVVLSHHGGRHSATALRHQLVQSGVSSTLILVKQGFRFGDAKQGRRSIKYNQIAMFSFLFRWLPAVSKFLCCTKRYSCSGVPGMHGERDLETCSRHSPGTATQIVRVPQVSSC